MSHSLKMIDEVVIPPVPPTLREALFPAFGYFVVAIACTWAGYAAGHQHPLPLFPEWPTFILFLAVLFPAYANRAILYELKLGDFNEHNIGLSWMKSFSIHVPLLLIAEGGGLSIFLFFYTRPPVSTSFLTILVRVAVTVAPMYLMGSRLTIRWPKDDRLFGFLQRDLFPAFATCLTPFVFGYSGYGDTICCAWSAGCVLFFWILSFWLPVLILVIVGALSLICLSVQQVFWLKASTAGWRCAGVIFFGTLMTLAMGVSQAWRVTERVQSNSIFRKKGRFTESEKSLYRGGTNLATALFLPCFLLTALHPSTSFLYLITIFCLMALQYCLWFIPATRRQIPWSKIGICFGLLLPIIVTFETQFPRSVIWPPPLWPFAADFGTLIAIGVPAVTLLGSLTKIFNSNMVRRDIPSGYSWVSRFEPFTPCVCITGGISAVLCVVIAGGAAAQPSILSIAETRMAHLCELYLVIALLCSGFVWTYRSHEKNKMKAVLHKKKIAAAESGAGGETRFADVRRAILGAFLLTRPITSLIAGLLTFLVFIRSDGVSVGAFGAGMAMTLATMFGFVLDDLWDFQRDRCVGKATALTLNRVSTRCAKWMSMCLAVVAVTISPGAIAGKSIILSTLLALFSYQYFSKVVPSWKGFYTAALACIPLFYGAFLTHVHVALLLYVALFVFIAGRELLIDAYQASADYISGFRTLAVRFGCAHTERLARAGMVIALLLLLASSQSWGAITLSALTLITTLWFSYAPIASSRRPELLRISLLLGVCAIAIIL